MYKTICVAFITFMVGMTTASVGKMPTNSGEPYSVWLPFEMLMILVIPAVLAYFAGREGD